MLDGIPNLDAGVITDLLNDYSYTVQVEDPDTGETVDETRYDLNRSASEGWLLKASRVSGYYRLNVDGQQLDRQQVYQHCLEQAVLFAAKARIRPQTVSRTDVSI